MLYLGKLGLKGTEVGTPTRALPRLLYSHHTAPKGSDRDPLGELGRQGKMSMGKRPGYASQLSRQCLLHLTYVAFPNLESIGISRKVLASRLSSRARHQGNPAFLAFQKIVHAYLWNF